MVIFEPISAITNHHSS